MAKPEPPNSLENSLAGTLPQLTQEQVASLTESMERVIQVLKPERIYLFGSHARGDATARSDIDLLVIVGESDLPPHRRDQVAYRAVGLHLLPLDILVMTREEFERRLCVVSSLPSTVEREGRVLYAA